MMGTLELESPIVFSRLARPEYRTTVLGSLDDFKTLREEWASLLEESGLENLSLCHEWLSTWLNHFPPSRLAVVTVRDDRGKLVGAMPLCICRMPVGAFRRVLRRLHFIGSELTIYDWIQIPIAAEVDRETVLWAMADALLGMKDSWDVMDLQFLKDKFQVDILHDVLMNRGLGMVVDEAAGIPYLTLPETTADYEKTTLDKETAKNLRRRKRKVEAELQTPLTLEFLSPSAETDMVFERFLAQHATYWKSRGNKGPLRRYPELSGFYKDVFRAMAPNASDGQPYLAFSIAKAGDDQHLCYQLSWHHANTQLLYITSYDQAYRSYGPGTLHLDALIQHAIANGIERLDLGRGDESYKTVWANEKQPLWNLLCFRSKIAARLWQADEGLRWLKRRGLELLKSRDERQSPDA